MRASVSIIPGIGNSGPLHRQTLWELSDNSISRLSVEDSDHPVCSSWVAAIDAEVISAKQPLVVAAHSLGCLAFVHWAAQCQRKIRGALLVAAPDPERTQLSIRSRGLLQARSLKTSV